MYLFYEIYGQQEMTEIDIKLLQSHVKVGNTEY